MSTLQSWMSGTSKLNAITYSLGFAAGLFLVVASSSVGFQAVGLVLANINVYGLWKGEVVRLPVATTLKLIAPLAFVMTVGGALLAPVGFFGGEPGGYVGRQIVEFRWELVLMFIVGVDLLVGRALTAMKAN